MKCYMMIGLPGSGKSWEAKEIAERENAVIVSSDAIRGELYGDESCQDNPRKVFEIVEKRVRKTLSSGRSVIMDATNISGKRRAEWVSQMKMYGAEMIAVYLDTPISICIERQDFRQRKVPVDVIRRMQRQFQAPVKKEGWDEIITIRTDENWG